MVRFPNATEGSQPALAERFLRGFWLGRDPTNNGHVVITEEGKIVSRTARALDEGVQKDPGFAFKVKWGDEPEAERAPSDGDEPGPSRNTFIQGFFSVVGRTPGCYACSYGPGGRAHNAACKQKQAEYRAQLEAACASGATLAAAAAAAAVATAGGPPLAPQPPHSRAPEPAAWAATGKRKSDAEPCKSSGEAAMDTSESRKRDMRLTLGYPQVSR